MRELLLFYLESYCKLHKDPEQARDTKKEYLSPRGWSGCPGDIESLGEDLGYVTSGSINSLQVTEMRPSRIQLDHQIATTLYENKRYHKLAHTFSRVYCGSKFFIIGQAGEAGPGAFERKGVRNIFVSNAIQLLTVLKCLLGCGSEHKPSF